MRRLSLLVAFALTATLAFAQAGTSAGGGGATAAPTTAPTGTASTATATTPSTTAATAVPQQAMPGPGTGTQPQLAMPPAGVAGQSNPQVFQLSPVGAGPEGILTTPSVSLGTPQAGAAGLQTPTMSLDGPSGMSPVGASAATGRLLPGATDSTMANHPDLLSAIDDRPRALLPFDRGAGDFSSVYDTAAATDPRPLGEVARTLKASRPQVARVITNADIARLNQQPGVTVPGGVSGNAVASPNPQPMAQSAPAGTISMQPTDNAQTPSPATTEATPPPPQMAQATPPPATGHSAQDESAPAPTAGAAPPGNASEQRGAASRSRLPATGTVLPIVAIMGLLAAAAGMFIRR